MVILVRSMSEPQLPLKLHLPTAGQCYKGQNPPRALQPKEVFLGNTPLGTPHHPGSNQATAAYPKQQLLPTSPGLRPRKQLIIILQYLPGSSSEMEFFEIIQCLCKKVSTSSLHYDFFHFMSHLLKSHRRSRFGLQGPKVLASMQICALLINLVI